MMSKYNLGVNWQHSLNNTPSNALDNALLGTFGNATWAGFGTSGSESGLVARIARKISEGKQIIIDGKVQPNRSYRMNIGGTNILIDSMENPQGGINIVVRLYGTGKACSRTIPKRMLEDGNMTGYTLSNVIADMISEIAIYARLEEI